MNATTPEIDYAKHGFRNTGFGSTVRACEICVVIVCNLEGLRPSFEVYLTHGAPGGQFWRNSPPLVRCDTRAEADTVTETLYGITGSAKFAMVVNR